jgi:hypothetical protein
MGIWGTFPEITRLESKFDVSSLSRTEVLWAELPVRLHDECTRSTSPWISFTLRKWIMRIQLAQDRAQWRNLLLAAPSGSISREFYCIFPDRGALFPPHDHIFLAPESWVRKIWWGVPRDPEPRMTVVASASSNLPDPISPYSTRSDMSLVKFSKHYRLKKRGRGRSSTFMFQMFPWYQEQLCSHADTWYTAGGPMYCVFSSLENSMVYSDK